MRKSGFSLLELSIVLVIIGLIAGGIVAGSAMIRAAELRAVITEHQHYQIAIHTFRDKYLGLPGDLNNATAFWGAAHATPATCLTTVGTGTETCDGDGDGIIGRTAASQYGELFTLWQHLANAELISGTYTGIAGSGSASNAILGSNTPESKLSGAGWTHENIAGTYAGDAYWFGIAYNNFLSFGTVEGNFHTWGQALTPEEAWNIDTKSDDGKPGQGKLIAGWYDPCTDRAAGENTQAHADAAEYDLTNKDVACGLVVRNVF